MGKHLISWKLENLSRVQSSLGKYACSFNTDALLMQTTGFSHNSYLSQMYRKRVSGPNEMTIYGTGCQIAQCAL